MSDQFNRWMRLHDLSGKEDPDSDVPEHSLEKMMEFAKTFDDWRNVFCRAEAGQPIKRMAFNQMATIAKSFGNWLSVYCEASDDWVVEKQIAMRQLMVLSDNPDDATWTKKREPLKLARWQKILAMSELDSKAEFIATQKIIGLISAKKRKENKDRQEREKINGKSSRSKI